MHKGNQSALRKLRNSQLEVEILGFANFQISSNVKSFLPYLVNSSSFTVSDLISIAVYSTESRGCPCATPDHTS